MIRHDLILAEIRRELNDEESVASGRVQRQVREIEDHIMGTSPGYPSLPEDWDSDEMEDDIFSPRNAKSFRNYDQVKESSLEYDADCSSRSSLTSIVLSYSDCSDSDIDEDEKEDKFDMWMAIPSFVVQYMAQSQFVDLPDVARVDSACNHEGKSRINAALRGLQFDQFDNYEHTSADSIRYMIRKGLKCKSLNIRLPVPSHWEGKALAAGSTISKHRIKVCKAVPAFNRLCMEGELDH